MVKFASTELLANPIIAALDVDSSEECFRLSSLLAGKVGAFKVGPRLCMRYGSDLVAKLSKQAPVFVDNKYLDIPSTMESALRATFEAGATLATVHAGAGKEALSLLAKTESELAKRRPFKVLAVTVLTSFTEATLPPTHKQESIAESVQSLAKLTLDCGLTGIVCSPHEVEAVRRMSSDAFLVTPGVRMAADDVGDQKRIETPEQAMQKGSSALVIGRPIIAAKDPVAALEAILDSLTRFTKGTSS